MMLMFLTGCNRQVIDTTFSYDNIAGKAGQGLKAGELIPQTDTGHSETFLDESGMEAVTIVVESIRDTLLDLANYAIMTVLEMDTPDESHATLYAYDKPVVFACVELIQPIADFLMSQNFFVHCDPP